MNLKLLGCVVALCSSLAVFSAQGHQVEISTDVGATLHIEPDDKAKAGESSQAFFILTQEGGKIIPLEQCNCKLVVYKQPISANALPILQPPLTPINAEEHKNVPGTNIIFPNVGTYELKLSGSPKSGATFKPFELSYPVTVAAGKPVALSPLPQQTQQVNASKTTTTAIASKADSQENLGLISGAIAALVIISGGAIWWVKKSR